MLSILENVKVLAMLIGIGCVSSSPLDDYVQHDDGYFKYEILRDQTYFSPGVTTYVLNMTAQKWLSENEVSRSIWWHYLVIHVPDEIDPDLQHAGFLFIDGDENKPDPPKPDDIFVELFRLVAVSSKTITAVLKNVPNNRIVFAADPQHRSMSDMDIIAYGWKLFIENPNRTEYTPLLPMAKSGVKAMDAITDFAGKTLGMNIDSFCVSGASKRGWAAWLTVAAEYKNRVKCLAPVVYDYLNMNKNFHHHFRAYGGWSFALNSFWKFNLTGSLDDKETLKMMDIIDPLTYKERLTMPKMMSSSTGDEYFLLDDSHYYLNQMEGPTYVNMIPNTEHTLVGHEFQLSSNLEAFYLSAMKNLKMPKLSWTLGSTSNGGVIDVAMDTKPSLIRAWHATTPNNTRRDFRLLIANPSQPSKSIFRPLLWESAVVNRTSDLTYTFEMMSPTKGWAAFFIQITFPGPDGRHFECTTETNVIPNTFPFPDCHGKDCQGTLV